MSADTRATKPCGVPGCPEPHKAKGYCLIHYLRFRRTGDPLKIKGPGRPALYEGVRCKYEGCTTRAAARDYCHYHYAIIRPAAKEPRPLRIEAKLALHWGCTIPAAIRRALREAADREGLP